MSAHNNLVYLNPNSIPDMADNSIQNSHTTKNAVRNCILKWNGRRTDRDLSQLLCKTYQNYLGGGCGVKHAMSDSEKIHLLQEMIDVSNGNCQYAVDRLKDLRRKKARKTNPSEVEAPCVTIPRAAVVDVNPADDFDDYLNAGYTTSDFEGYE